MDNDFRKINGAITILSSYDDVITITIVDRTSGIEFAELELTREQFVNATMNRLSRTPVKSLIVNELENVGKKYIHKNFECEIPSDIMYNDVKATEIIKMTKPDGWRFRTSFSSKGAYFHRNGKTYVRVLLYKYVNSEDTDETD